MKREELKQIEGMTPEMIDKIMQLHQADATTWNSRFDNQQQSINEKVAIIDGLNNKYKAFDGIDVKALQKEASDWKAKYENDMAKVQKDHAKEALFNSIKWNSNLAKSGAMAQFDQANLEFKDGAFVGADKFLEDLKQSDPTAFGNENQIINTGLAHGGSPLQGDDGLSDVEALFYEMNPHLKR